MHLSDRDPDPHPDRHPELVLDPDALVPRPPHVQVSLVLLVAAGGAVGALLRYSLSVAFPTADGRWPAVTFATNLLGALLLGVLLELLARRGPDAGSNRAVRLAIGTGVLGAFTTYSTLATEVVLLGQDGRAGLAVAYGLTSAVAGFAAAAAGIGLAALHHRRAGT